METLRLKTRYWTPTKARSSSSAPRSESVNMTDVYWDNRADVEAARGYNNNNREEVRDRGPGDSGHGSYGDLGEAEGERQGERERAYAD